MDDFPLPTPHEARFPPGTQVRIADLLELARFQADGKNHHPLEPEQLEHAGLITRVRSVTLYDGGDPLYSLDKAPGQWHEQCLRPALQVL